MDTNSPINNESTNEINHSLDAIVEILQRQVVNLKNKLQEEREEHRSIYAKIKQENEYLRELLNKK
jgi:ribosome-associated translation inhibitor RaiA